MKKALRKLIPAFVMLLIAAAFVGTSTFAWFSMNRVVNVSGMSVTTKVEDSLLISETNSEANYFAGPLAQNRVGKLRPASSSNGVDFFYSEAGNVTGNGSARSATYSAYSEATNAAPDAASSGKAYYDAAFNTAYGVTSPAQATVVYAYMDYTFFIKATNVNSGNADLKLTTLNLAYNNGNVGEKAWRVAVFAQTATKDTPLATAPTTSDRKAILAFADSANYTQTEDDTPLPKAVSATNATAGVTYASSGWYLAQLATGATGYYKVTVRLWLEGEDTTCTNDTFATLTSAYTLNLTFHLGGSETAVTAISTPAATPVVP